LKLEVAAHEKYLQPLIQNSGFLSSIVRVPGRGVRSNQEVTEYPAWLACLSDCQGCQADGVIVADLTQSFQHQLATLQRRLCVLLELQGGDEEKRASLIG
jgi:hypothetical protein